MRLRAYLERFGYSCRWLWIGLATVACVFCIETRTLLTPPRVKPERYARLARIWGRLFLAGNRCSIEGAHNIPHGTAVIFASNHQSAFDIPLFHALLPVAFRWMANRAFFSWPFIGLALRRMKAIPMHRGSRAEVRRSWEEAVASLKGGHSIVIFPEGTWGDRDGRMLPFQKGVISIAREADVPVVPITIAGSNRVNPPRTKEIHPGEIRMIVHPPIGPDTWRGVSDEEWLAGLRARIAENLERGAAPAETGG